MNNKAIEEGRKIATGFNEEGERSFKQWMEAVANHQPNGEQIQAYFDSMSNANFETGENCIIELGSTETKSGNPQTFIVPREWTRLEEVGK